MRRSQTRNEHSLRLDDERDVWTYWLDVLAGVLSPVFPRLARAGRGLTTRAALLRVLERRSCWQLAEVARHLSPQRLQGLLCEYRWKAETLVARVGELVVSRLGEPDAVLAIDETAEIKRGTRGRWAWPASTPGSPGRWRTARPWPRWRTC
jgi:hypothetical protein